MPQPLSVRPHRQERSLQRMLFMSIDPGHQEGYYGAAKYVDMILRGANPAELPVAPTKSIDFSVSRSALKHIGLVLPEEVSNRVNDLID